MLHPLLARMALDRQFLLLSGLRNMQALAEHGMEISPLPSWWDHPHSLDRPLLSLQAHGKPTVLDWEGRGRKGSRCHPQTRCLQRNHVHADCGPAQIAGVSGDRGQIPRGQAIVEPYLELYAGPHQGTLPDPPDGVFDIAFNFYLGYVLLLHRLLLFLRWLRSRNAGIIGLASTLYNNFLPFL